MEDRTMTTPTRISERTTLTAALATLSRTDTLVLDLTCREHLTDGEIARVLDITEIEVIERRLSALGELRQTLRTGGGAFAAMPAFGRDRHTPASMRRCG
jgi:DNA-directed RNA polymerase specialized sigma subunit